MIALSRRAALAAGLALAVTVGVTGIGAAVPATGSLAADGLHADQHDRGSPDDRCDHGNSSENRNDTACRDGDNGNSSFVLRLDVAGENPGGEGHYVCTGTPLRHECDKGGELAVGPVAFDYAGDNYANLTGMYGGGGDHFTVSAENRSRSVGFGCDFRESTIADGPCSVTTNSSEGSVSGRESPATPTAPGVV